MNKVLIVIGSFRKESYNHQLGLIIKEMLEKEFDVENLEYQDLQLFNQDEEFEQVEVINRIRTKIKECDGIWFITPEYNGSYPGSLKNLIDWLSRPLVLNRYQDGTAIAAKKVTYSSVAGKSKGINARDKLHELLNFVGADILNYPSVGIALTKEDFSKTKLSIHDDDLRLIQKQAEAFIEYIKNRES